MWVPLTWRSAIVILWGALKCTFGLHDNTAYGAPYHVRCQRCGRDIYAAP
jgi:hypothetical protein